MLGFFFDIFCVIYSTYFTVIRISRPSGKLWSKRVNSEPHFNHCKGVFAACMLAWTHDRRTILDLVRSSRSPELILFVVHAIKRRLSPCMCALNIYKTVPRQTRMHTILSQNIGNNCGLIFHPNGIYISGYLAHTTLDSGSNSKYNRIYGYMVTQWH